MSAASPSRISLPARTFGTDDSELETGRSSNGRVSFSSNNVGRPSFISRLRGNVDEEATDAERPLIPSALPESYATPLPLLSMVVLSIAMLGELLSATVCTPFLLFMVKDFGEYTEEADIALWTGILVSVFFLTQFLTSLLWATIADKHGQRAVLFVSLFGSAATCFIFGTTTSLNQAIAVRLLQGIFGGAIGVARGCVTNIGTDATNESRAYAILGFAWGLGGVSGAVIGGTFESPVTKFPGIFGSVALFAKYPYLLPCAMASSITLLGSLLSLFLARNAGPRSGAIRLAEKVDGEIITAEDGPVIDGNPDIVGTLRKKASKRFSGYFGNSRAQDVPAQSPALSEHSILLGSPSSPKPRAFSRTSRANGSAYGYSGSFRDRIASNATLRRDSVTSSVRRRRPSNLEGPQPSDGTEDFNFAQRLLMSNADHVTHIADLWVASAVTVDNEDPFESDSEDGDSSDEAEGSTPRGSTIRGNRMSMSGNRMSRSLFPTSSRRPSYVPIPQRRGSNAGASPQGTPTQRRFSTVVPAIFAQTGVRTPPAVVEAQQLLARTDELVVQDSLAPIAESRRVSLVSPTLDVVSEKAPSLNSQIPMLVIIQYGLLALHNTTHDQVFMSYLVTDFDGGGLNLNAGHFAQLIAVMCACQIFYQFFLYPNLGPPRGRFSHLAMFRLGCLLYIPSYLGVILLRRFASETSDGNAVLMICLTLVTSVRYCAGTLSYTAVSILLNYMTPPNAIGYANGIAQSMVSLARFVGPVLGGWLWSESTGDNPKGFPIPFIICAVVCGLSILHSLTIR